VNKNENTLNKVGLIIDNKNKPIRLVNYNTVNYYKQKTSNGTIRGIFYKDWSLIPFTKEEFNKVYKVMDESARKRKNLSTIRSSSSSNNKDKAKRIKRKENKTSKLANAFKTIRNLM